MSAPDHHLLAGFEGPRLPGELGDLLAADGASGATLFRFHNVASAAQVRTLTDDLQASAGEGPPLLVAADQEGGQLLGLGDDTTPFAGNMALGAVGDEELAERVARATGRELRALGVNVDYAPVCDLATTPANPALGIRSFGDDPAGVAALTAATVRGLAEAGVAATAKHFPGKGDVTTDTHHGPARIDHDRERFTAVEAAPFRSAIAAGARLVMSGHVAVPGLTGDPDLPATLAPAVMGGLLRDELGFDGVAITDALDMGAIAQGAGQLVDAVAALRAGVDLLLCPPDLDVVRRLRDGLRLASHRGLLDEVASERSRERILALRKWLADAGERPSLDVVGSPEHQAIARELAERSVTLVRDVPGLLPLRLATGFRIAAISPTARNLTPADTSSTVPPLLARELRRHHGEVDEFVTGHPPTAEEIEQLAALASSYDLLVVGTIDAVRDRAQAELVRRLVGSGVPAVTVALRTPWDLGAYPESPTHVCTYGILRPSVAALADTLFGAVGFRGHLPVALPDLYERGHAA